MRQDECRRPKKSRTGLVAGVGRLANRTGFFGDVLKFVGDKILELVGQIEITIDHQGANVDVVHDSVAAQSSAIMMKHEEGEEKAGGQYEAGRTQPVEPMTGLVVVPPAPPLGSSATASPSAKP